MKSEIKSSPTQGNNPVSKALEDAMYHLSYTETLLRARRTILAQAEAAFIKADADLANVQTLAEPGSLVLCFSQDLKPTISKIQSMSGEECLSLYNWETHENTSIKAENVRQIVDCSFFIEAERLVHEADWQLRIIEDVHKTARAKVAEIETSLQALHSVDFFS